MIRRIGFTCTMMLALALAACASSGRASGEPDEFGGGGAPASGTVTFDIDNNLSGIVGVTVYLVRDAGTRRTVGQVESGRRQQFNVPAATGTYNLVARATGQNDLVSERFRLDAGIAAVAWDMRANVLRFANR